MVGGNITSSRKSRAVGVSGLGDDGLVTPKATTYIGIYIYIDQSIFKAKKYALVLLSGMNYVPCLLYALSATFALEISP